MMGFIYYQYINNANGVSKMKISIQDLIDLKACDNGKDRFCEATDYTHEPVEVTSLIGSCITISDFLWLAGETLPTKKIVDFACKCALINIEKIKPFTDDYDGIVSSLNNQDPSGANRSSNVAYVAYAGARTMGSDSASCAAKSAYYACSLTYSSYGSGNFNRHVSCHSAGAANLAVEAGASTDEVNKLLIELFDGAEYEKQN